jgi:hypothetical protein
MAEQQAALRRAATTRTLGWLLLIPLVGAAVFGGNLFDVRDRAFPAPTKLSTSQLNTIGRQVTSGQTTLAAQPYWVPAAALTGSGSGTRSVSIDSDALQWKVDWQCGSGSITIDARKPAATTQSIAKAAPCSAQGEGFGVDSGTFTLAITATSDWTLTVQQKLDRPQNSAPLAAMSAPGSAVIASGAFYNIDQFGQGTARIYRLADGSHALRLDNFYVTPNTDFEIRLSVLQHPTSTPEFVAAQFADVAPLPITAGSFNFTIPSSVDPTAYHSVVIWCERLTSAYSGATLSTS